MRVVKSTYYSNWGDLFGYKIAHLLLPLAVKIPYLTPNIVTLMSFASFALGSIFLLLPFPLKVFGGLMIVAGYIGDDLDGQLARETKKYSIIGDYLDKVLDIIKIFVITFFAGLSVYLTSGNVLFIILGFVSAFFFMLRYYIKLETMFSSISRDEKYLEKSAEKRGELEHKMDLLYAKKPESVSEFFSILWVKMRTMFLVDEAEFAIFICVGAIADRIGLVLCVIAISQVLIAVWRGFERGYQLTTNSNRLLHPLRK